jgi:hypothetical protein
MFIWGDRFVPTECNKLNHSDAPGATFCHDFASIANFQRILARVWRIANSQLKPNQIQVLL